MIARYLWWRGIDGENGFTKQSKVVLFGGGLSNDNHINSSWAWQSGCGGGRDLYKHLLLQIYNKSLKDINAPLFSIHYALFISIFLPLIIHIIYIYISLN